ncbi:hypothetical protein EHM69_03740 [candidate division KSB1 bacterium]|nr:MAG: hypothetical protein EHM69_03740 [candidate division KSB1 bacterium]
MADSDILASRYRILKTIGSGGMGVVCLVEDTRRDNKIMALKTMKQGLESCDVDGFKAEFSHISGVVHPNIPEVYDFGTLPPPENTLYFTYEYIEGRPIHELIPKWKASQLHVVLVKLCRALAFLHSRGLLHRDIKPENVLGCLNAEGQVESLKLLDFGLAARRGQDIATGGTVDYMAPELIAEQKATAATDIYAAGMMLYRLATGRLPFEGKDSLTASRQRCQEEAPPPLRFRPDLPVGLSDVISAMVRLKPEDRPPSARHAIALLNEREGTDFPLETEVTRRAYIRSATSVTNITARQTLQELKTSIQHGGNPPAVVLLGPHGLGRRRMLRDFGARLSVDGINVCIADTAVALNEECRDRVLLIPDASDIPNIRLNPILRKARENGIWCVIGTTHLDDQTFDAIGHHREIVLQPLDLKGVHEFIAATFPENSFPDSFAEQIFSESMGFASAIQNQLDRLLEAGMLRIGLGGWELLPGSWASPVHSTVVEYMDHMLADQSEEACRLAYYLACSLTPLPQDVLREMFAEEEHPAATLHRALNSLETIGWLHHGAEGFSLRFTAVADFLEGILDEETSRDIHERLARAWSSLQTENARRRKRERLYHDFYAGMWTIPPQEAGQILHGALEDGETKWVRRLIESCLLHNPPEEIWTVILDALVAIEYMEGNLEASSAHLADYLNNGKVEVTSENLERLSRYAMIEEKLGRTEHAQTILEQCLTRLPEGHDSRAGIVYGTLAWIAFKHGEAETARQLAEDGLIRVPPQSTDPGQAMLMNTVATLAFYRGDSDAASLYWRRCLEIQEALHDRKGVANMYNNLGVLAAQSGDRLHARSLWKKCAEIASEINDVHRLAGIYNNLGVDSLETGSLPEAEEYYLKALGLFRRMNSPREQVEILSNLGELSYYRADFPRAHAYFQEAVSLASTLEDYECEIEPLVYLGKLLLALEELENASSVLERAYRAAHEVGARKGEGQAWEGIALLRARRGRTEGAREALDQAQTLLSDDSDPLARLHLHLTACAIAAEQGDIESAKTALTQARKVADIKWDPYTAARTLVYGLLFAQETIDSRERPRIVRQLSAYPDLLWRYHWATARHLAAEGTVRKGLEEYGRGATVLKAVAARLSESSRERFLASPQIRRFREEAITLRNSLKEN